MRRRRSGARSFLGIDGYFPGASDEAVFEMPEGLRGKKRGRPAARMMETGEVLVEVRRARRTPRVSFVAQPLPFCRSFSTTIARSSANSSCCRKSSRSGAVSICSRSA